MFGEGWLFVFALLLLASVLMRDGLLFIVSLALLLAAGASSLWDRYCLDGVEYRRRFSQRRAFFGEEVTLTIEIVNRKALPLAWIEAEDEIPEVLPPLKVRVSPHWKPYRSLLTNLLSLRWYERVRRHYRIRCDVRGHHAFGPVRLRSGDVFGFFRKEFTLADEDHLLVYPRVLPISQLGLPSKDPFGDRKTRQWIFEDPLRTVGVREYTYGDSLQRIHWKATARTQQLQVKLYEPTTTYRLVVFLNMHTTGHAWWWQAYQPDLLELAISTAASIASWAVENGYQVGLYANSRAYMSDGRIKVTPGRDPQQLTHILEALAKVLPFATLSMEELLRLEGRELPYGATLVVVTAVVSEEILAELFALKAAGHRVVLLLIGDRIARAKLDGIVAYHIGDEDNWQKRCEIAVGVT